MKSWLIAILSSICIATLTTILLLATDVVSPTQLYPVLLGTLVVSFLLIWILLDLLFFRHIRAIYKMIDKIEKNDYSSPDLSTNPKLNPLSRINKELFGYVLTKQKEIERLKELARYRREFIADISHELKTPLFAAQGFVHTLMDGAIKDKNVRGKFLKKAARSLDGLDILIQDLLTISQIESGAIKMNFESFDVVALGLRVIDQMETKAEKKGLHVLLENDEFEQIFVHADYRRIYQVFLNLVSNAIKYTENESDIFLRFEETDDSVRCSVIDRGVGIAEEDLGRIFERFFRVDKSRSTGGTGLGLAIVKHVLEGHGTQVRVVSQVDKGSTFSFQLIKGNPTEYVEHDEY